MAKSRTTTPFKRITIHSTHPCPRSTSCWISPNLLHIVTRSPSTSTMVTTGVRSVSRYMVESLARNRSRAENLERVQILCLHRKPSLASSRSDLCSDISPNTRNTRRSFPWILAVASSARIPVTPLSLFVLRLSQILQAIMFPFLSRVKELQSNNFVHGRLEECILIV